MESNILTKYINPKGEVWWISTTPPPQYIDFPHYVEHGKLGDVMTTYVNPLRITEYHPHGVRFIDGRMWRIPPEHYCRLLIECMTYLTTKVARIFSLYFRGLVDENTFLRALLTRLSSETIPSRQFVAKKYEKPEDGITSYYDLGRGKYAIRSHRPAHTSDEIPEGEFIQVTSTWYINPVDLDSWYISTEPSHTILTRQSRINHENKKLIYDLERFVVQIREENSYLAERIAEAQAFSPGELGAELTLADLKQLTEQNHSFDIA